MFALVNESLDGLRYSYTWHVLVTCWLCSLCFILSCGCALQVIWDRARESQRSPVPKMYSQSHMFVLCYGLFHGTGGIDFYSYWSIFPRWVGPVCETISATFVIAFYSALYLGMARNVYRHFDRLDAVPVLFERTLWWCPLLYGSLKLMSHAVVFSTGRQFWWIIGYVARSCVFGTLAVLGVVVFLRIRERTARMIAAPQSSQQLKRDMMHLTLFVPASSFALLTIACVGVLIITELITDGPNAPLEAGVLTPTVWDAIPLMSPQAGLLVLKMTWLPNPNSSGSTTLVTPIAPQIVKTAPVPLPLPVDQPLSGGGGGGGGSGVEMTQTLSSLPPDVLHVPQHLQPHPAPQPHPFGGVNPSHNGIDAGGGGVAEVRAAPPAPQPSVVAPSSSVTYTGSVGNFAFANPNDRLSRSVNGNGTGARAGGAYAVGAPPPPIGAAGPPSFHSTPIPVASANATAAIVPALVVLDSILG